MSTTSTTRKRPVLTGFDGSAAARCAALWAAEEASRRGCPLLIARAYERPIDITDLTWTPVGLSEYWSYWARAVHCDQAVRMLADQCRSEQPGLTVETKTRAGHPGDVLGVLADETDAELVVLGAADHGPVARMVLGSTAAELVHHIRRPVVAIRREARTQPAPVLLGLAGTAEDGQAIDFAFDFAARHGCPLHAVHAQRGRARAAQAEHVLAPWRERYPAVAVRTDVLADKPAHALVARSADARLLVVGSHHHNALHRMLLGSVSHAALFHAACPVAVVPTAHHQTPQHATTAMPRKTLSGR